MIRKRLTPAQKAAITLELLQGEETLPQIAARHGLHPNLLRKWRTQALEGLPHLFTAEDHDQRARDAEHQRQLHELYAEIGQLTTQLNWLKKKSGLEVEPR